MKRVTWEDEDGYLHISILRNSDSERYPQRGIPEDPPSVHELDWDGIKRDLNNLLVQRGLISFKDVAEKRGQLANAVKLTVFNALLEQYRLKERSKSDD